MSNVGSHRTLVSSMTDISEFGVLAGKSTIAGQIVQLGHLGGWYLRCESPPAEDDDEQWQWLLDLGEDHPFTLLSLENITSDPALVLSSFRLQVDYASRKPISSLHGMKEWAVLTESWCGVVADEPGNGLPARKLVVGLDGQFYRLTAGMAAFAFASWRLVTGTADDLRVVYERKREPDPA